MRLTVAGLIAALLYNLFITSSTPSSPSGEKVRITGSASQTSAAADLAPMMLMAASPRKEFNPRFTTGTGRTGEGNDYDMDVRFYRGEDLSGLYGLMGCVGDNQIAARSIWQGTQAKRSQDIRARFDSDNFRKWFADGELDRENQHWWEDVDELWGHAM